MAGALTATLLVVAAFLASTCAQEHQVRSSRGASRGVDDKNVQDLLPEGFDSEHLSLRAPRLPEEIDSAKYKRRGTNRRVVKRKRVKVMRKKGKDDRINNDDRDLKKKGESRRDIHVAGS